MSFPEEYPTVDEFFGFMDSYDCERMAELLQVKGYCIALPETIAGRERDIAALTAKVAENAQYITDLDVKQLREMSGRNMANQNKAQ